MSVTRYILDVGGQTGILDPGEIYKHHLSLRVPADFWGKANSIHCPIGTEPGSAWILMSRAAGDALAKNSFHSIRWYDSGHARKIVTFQNYVLHRAVLQGLDGDGKAPYLCEFRDKRQVLKLSILDADYNIQRPHRFTTSSADDGYYRNTTDGGTPWGWQTLLEDIWAAFPAAIAGTCPTIPTEAIAFERPANLSFRGVPPMEAVEQVLEQIHCRLALDPVNDTFSVVRLGAAQAEFPAASLTDINMSICPATFQFYFRKRFLSDGQWNEHTSSSGITSQIRSPEEPYYILPRNSGLTGAYTGTTMAVHMPQYADCEEFDSTPMNSGPLGVLATQQATKLAERLNRGTERGLYRFSGIVTGAAVGSEIHSITWRDFGDSDGTVTEMRRDALQGLIPKRQPIEPPQPDAMAIFVMGTTLDACDLSTANLYDSSHPGMPSAAYSSLYFPGNIGGVNRFQEHLARVTVFNPLPFQWTTGQMFWVKRIGSMWFIDRPINTRPIAHFARSSDTPLDSSLLLGLSAAYQVGAIAESASSPTNRITITCPATGPYRVSLKVKPYVTPTAAATEFNVALAMAIKNGSGATQDTVRDALVFDMETATAAAVDPISGDSNTLTLSLDWVGLLSKDWYLETSVTIAGDTSGSGYGIVRYAQLTIEPLFG